MQVYSNSSVGLICRATASLQLITLVDPFPGMNAHLLRVVETSSRGAGPLHNIQLVGTLEESSRIPSGEQRVGPVLVITAIHWQAVHRSRHQMGLITGSLTASWSVKWYTPSITQIVARIALASILPRTPETVFAARIVRWIVHASTILQSMVRRAHALSVDPFASIASRLAGVIARSGVFRALVGVIVDSGGRCVEGELFPQAARNTSLEGWGEKSADGTSPANGISPARALPVGAAVALESPLHAQLESSATSWLDGRSSATKDDCDQSQKNHFTFVDHDTDTAGRYRKESRKRTGWRKHG